MAWTMESDTVLPDNTNFNTCCLQLCDTLSMLLAPLSAIQKQHISSFWLGDMDALEMFLDVVAGVIDIAAQNLFQFIYLLISFWLVGTDQRIHG